VNANDARQAAIERAVRAVALGRLSEVEAVAAIANAIAMPTPRENAAAARQSLREKMLAGLSRLEAEGRGRSAVMLVARKFASDPLDPIEVESLARKLRRWRGEKNGHWPFAESKLS
jgi:hypothetical protein